MTYVIKKVENGFTIKMTPSDEEYDRNRRARERTFVAESLTKAMALITESLKPIKPAKRKA